AAAERKARHSRDHRLAHLGGEIAVAAEVFHEYVDVSLVRHLLDVGAGGESLLGAREHDAGNAGVLLERRNRRVELLEQRGGERVEHPRPVEADDPDFALGLDQDVLVSHAGPLFLANRTEERRTSGLHDTLDRTRTFRRRALLAFAIIDAKMVLEIAELAVGLAMIAQRRSALLEGVVEHGL